MQQNNKHCHQKVNKLATLPIANNSAQNSTRITIAIIGNFDGLHLGHQLLISNAHKIANIYKQNGFQVKKVAITFAPTTANFFSDIAHKKRQPCLGLLRDKVSLLRATYNFDQVVVLRFNQQLANKSASLFISEYLLQRLQINHMIVGNDFRFGKNALGNAEDIRRAGIKVSCLEPALMNQKLQAAMPSVAQLKDDGKDDLAHNAAECIKSNQTQKIAKISSSLIRLLASNNQLQEVKNLLGRNLSYTSKVVHGAKLGRKYGTPTINFNLGRAIPAVWGVYVAYVHIDNKRYQAVASAGLNPTVSVVSNYKLEAHLLDIDMNLYGKIATIEILHFLRKEHKFISHEALFDQIHQDIIAAKTYFSQLSRQTHYDTI